MLNTEYTVVYKDELFIVWRDGAGLDMMATGTTTTQTLMTGAGDDLFNALVDIYNALGLEKALEQVGATIIVVKNEMAAI